MFTESISSIVYHYTSHVNAYNIIKNNEFHMSPTFIHPSNIEGSRTKKFFYLSTTRSKLGHFHQNEISGVIFKLNGDTINQRLKGTQVNYYSDLKINDEMEDRILSDKPTLSLDGIVQSIDILISTTHNNDVFNKISYFLYVYGKKHGIPVFVYTDRQSVNTSNTKNALSFDAIKKLNTGTLPNVNYRSTDIPYIIGLYHKPYADLNKKELMIRNEIIKNPDFHQSIRRDFDVLRNTNGGINLLHNISKILKKESLSTYKELLVLLKERFMIEDNERQKANRIQAAKNKFKKESFVFQHVLNVLNKEEEFKKEYLEASSDEVLVMKISNILSTLEILNLIPVTVERIWYDEYGMSEDGYRNFFNLVI